MALRRKRKSRTVAPACIYFTQQKNEEGKKQLCVYGECTYGGTKVGPVWSHSKSSVDRCLAMMSKQCDCGRSYHKHRYTEGIPIRNQDK